MVIRWDSESDWENEQDSSGAVGRIGDLKQGYSRESPDLSNGLVGYWPLHDDSATDYSGSGNHGSLNNGVTTGVSGKGGLQAMSFDGNDDYIGEGALQTNNSSLSVSVWIKGAVQSSYGAIVAANSTDSNEEWVLRRDDSGNYEFIVGTGSSQENEQTISESDIEDGDWHHIVATCNGAEAKFYLDGELVETSNVDVSASSTGVYIGKYDAGGSSYHYEGVIGDVRVYDSVLTDQEIQKLYRWGSGDFARPPGQSDGGVSYWPLDGNVDDSWRENNGSVNGASFIADAIRGQALDFNGSDDYVQLDFSTLELPVTISAWTKIRDLNGDNHIFSNHNSTSDDLALFYADGGSHFRFVHDAGNTISTGDDLDIDDDVWYHVVGVIDSTDIYLYVNGVQMVSESDGSTSNVDNSSNFRIGSRADGTQKMDGIIDDVRIFNRALDLHEIFELYLWGTKGRDLRKQLVNF